jgi:hypothetical protein
VVSKASGAIRSLPKPEPIPTATVPIARSRAVPRRRLEPPLGSGAACPHLLCVTGDRAMWRWLFWGAARSRRARFDPFAFLVWLATLVVLFAIVWLLAGIH